MLVIAFGGRGKIDFIFMSRWRQRMVFTHTSLSSVVRICTVFLHLGMLRTLSNFVIISCFCCVGDFGGYKSACFLSPVGDSFRNRLRMFPSLVNCCTIDWFTEWPNDALISVAQQFLGLSFLTTIN